MDAEGGVFTDAGAGGELRAEGGFVFGDYGGVIGLEFGEVNVDVVEVDIVFIGGGGVVGGDYCGD